MITWYLIFDENASKKWSLSSQGDKSNSYSPKNCPGIIIFVSIWDQNWTAFWINAIWHSPITVYIGHTNVTLPGSNSRNFWPIWTTRMFLIFCWFLYEILKHRREDDFQKICFTNLNWFFYLPKNVLCDQNRNNCRHKFDQKWPQNDHDSGPKSGPKLVRPAAPEGVAYPVFNEKVFLLWCHCNFYGQ